MELGIEQRWNSESWSGGQNRREASLYRYKMRGRHPLEFEAGKGMKKENLREGGAGAKWQLEQKGKKGI